MLSLVLSGCGIDAYSSFWPDAFKDPKPQRKVELPPNIKAIVGNNLALVFAEGSHPRNAQFSFPIPAKLGGWTTCIRANVDGIQGSPIGRRTYLVEISDDHVGPRELVDEKHWCNQETFQPL